MLPETSTDHPGEAARTVLAAFKAAVAAGKELHECYLAGIDAWHRRVPRRPRSDVAHEAVTIILGASYPGVAGSRAMAAPVSKETAMTRMPMFGKTG